MHQQSTQQKARELYQDSGKSVPEIANSLGVGRRTIYHWMEEGNWRKLKLASLQAPALIQEQFYSQLAELNYHISKRPVGARFPSKDEVDILRKLTIAIERVRLQPSLAANIQMMLNFCKHVADDDPHLANTITAVADKYLLSERKNGYFPYDIEYNADELIKQEAAIDQPQNIAE